MKFKNMLEKLGILSEEFDKKLEDCQLSSTREEREKFKQDWEMFSKIKGKTSEEWLAVFKEFSGAKELREQLELVEELNKPVENFERKVGEQFDYEGTTLEVVEDFGGISCSKCFFNNIDCEDITIRGTCLADKREDETEVHFIKVIPIQTKQPQEGMKFDQGKLDYLLLPFKAITEVVKVLEFGKQKYAEDSWKTVPNGKRRYLKAAFRHFVDYLEGKTVDEESGLPTLAHAVCDLLFVLWLDITGHKV
jgi:hypothetical protein